MKNSNNHQPNREPKKQRRAQILAVDDEHHILDTLDVILKNKYKLITAKNAAEALEIIGKHDIQLVILDLGLPDMPGLELLEKMKEINPQLECVVLTGDASLDSGLKAMKSGAYDYLVKPFDVDKISIVIENALERRNLWREVRYRRLDDENKQKNIIGQSPEMKEVFELTDRIADTDATVLITGESGTGKELVARAIHEKSIRQGAPFVTVNCGAMPKDLVESELFGHEKGAFTNATHKKLGKFEIADQGTIFLDEIGVLPLNSQTKLLRVLQERTFERVGGTSQIPVDVRIIAATNLDLEKEVEKGNFRDDLYYRLNVVPLKMPPLRERKSDIPILVDHFLKIYNRKYAKQVKKLPDEVILHLENYDWPGNVRELENIIQRLLVISGDSEIALEQLPLELIARSTSQLGRQKSFNLKHAVNHFERDYIRRTLLKTNNVQKDAAQMLGIHRNTLMSKMKELNLAPKNI